MDNRQDDECSIVNMPASLRRDNSRLYPPTNEEYLLCICAGTLRPSFVVM
jgi:hypothetical protein